MNLLGKPPKITDKPIQKITNGQLDLKLGQFMKEELDTVWKKLKQKSYMLQGKHVWKTKDFMTYFSDYAM